MILKQTKKLTLAAMFFAIGLILPLFIAQIPTIGQMLLPMHIPVLLCGLIVGWEYGLAVGFSSTCQKHLFWNAGYVSECRFHGL